MRRAELDEAFTAFVAARSVHLRRTAYLLCGDVHLAEDLLQTALVKLYVAWPRVSRRESAEAYVRQILVRANIDDSRRPWRRIRVLPVLPESPQPPDHRIDDQDEVFAALRELPAGQRAAVVLRYWHDLSVEEAAALMSCSTSTVKSQSARGLRRLRQAMSTSDTTVEESAR